MSWPVRSMPCRCRRSPRWKLGSLEWRYDPQRGALVAHDLERVAEKAETLARLRDGARLRDHQSRDGGGVIFRQLPIQFAVEIAHRHRALHQIGPIGPGPHMRTRIGMMLLGQLA